MLTAHSSGVGDLVLRTDPDTFGLIVSILKNIANGTVAVDWPALVCGTPDELECIIKAIETKGADDGVTVACQLTENEWTLLLGFIFVSPAEELSEWLERLDDELN